LKAPGFQKGEEMKKQRQNHSAVFKVKVALEAAKEEKTLTELSQQYGVHVQQISAWKRQLLAQVSEIFENGADRRRDVEAEVKELHAKIGELTQVNGTSRWL
jgi:transposase-like protein